MSTGFFTQAYGCHTSDHLRHRYVPWYYFTPYDHSCRLCGYVSALVFGTGQSAFWLCDCCATDWAEYTGSTLEMGSELTALELMTDPTLREEYHRLWDAWFNRFLEQREATRGE